MNTIFRKTIFSTFLLLFFAKIQAQQSDNNFYNEIKNFDISKLVASDSIIIEDNKEKIIKAQPLGFIGSDYQRFFIHFISVIQNPKNPYEYFVYGKTKVKETIRPFQGTLTIKKALIGKSSKFTSYEQGFATCEINFNEDKKLSSTGFINGTMKIGYVLDPKKNLRYDALSFYSDSFSNNTFKGIWTSYKTNISKKCNCGDYRIPESGDLDIGAGEFSPDSKYFDKGWKYYILTLSGETEVDVQIGKDKEKVKWWK
jgi:hypothetical protein